VLFCCPKLGRLDYFVFRSRAFWVLAFAAAFEALMASFRRSSAVIDFARAKPPCRASSDRTRCINSS
jgi:hypothetical protein